MGVSISGNNMHNCTEIRIQSATSGIKAGKAGKQFLNGFRAYVSVREIIYARCVDNSATENNRSDCSKPNYPPLIRRKHHILEINPVRINPAGQH
jgi:hypothetical protein